MTHKNFAFIRVAPVPQWGIGKRRKGGKPGKNTGLAGHVAHDLRFMVTNNADPERMKDNIILCERTGWKPVSASKENLAKLGINDPNFLSKLAKEKLKEMGIKAQKNHVKCAAFINSVSPEFLRDGSESGELNPKKVKTWMRATVKFNRQKHGNNLLMICFHMDELNPHASVYALPVREKSIKKGGRPCKGEEDKPREYFKAYRLDYWEIYTRDPLKYEIDDVTKEKKLARIGYGTCSKLQDEYTRALQDEGLDVQRGIRRDPNSPARKHQEMRKHYDNKRQATEEVSNMSEDDLRDFVTEKIENIMQVDRLISERDHYQIAGAVAQKKADELEKQIEESMRDIPVADVIRAITGTAPINGTPSIPSGEDQENSPKSPTHQLEFHLQNGQRLGVDPARNRFENLTPHIPFRGEGAKRRSASGAINAVMYLTGCSYDAATVRLATRFGNDAAKRAAAKKIEEEANAAVLRLVARDDSKWPELLLKLRRWKIDEELIKHTQEANRLWVNSEGHLVFRKQHFDENNELKDSGQIVIDPEFPAVTVLERGENGLFMAFEPTATHNVLCATPTDALAIRSLPNHQNANVIAIGGHPNENTIRSLRIFLNTFPDATYYAENLLAAGHRISKWLAANFAETIKMIPLPEGYRHWLDYHFAAIMEAPEIKSPKQSEPDENAIE